MHPKAAKYERLYPDTGIPEAQAAERMDRMEYKQRRRDGGRTARYVTVPELPWKKEKP